MLRKKEQGKRNVRFLGYLPSFHNRVCETVELL
jgi:hypothetical protein